MESQITIRIPNKINKNIHVFAKKLYIKRSDIVRIALEKFFENCENMEEKPYDNVKNLIGSINSGITDLGESHRKYLKKKIKKI